MRFPPPTHLVVCCYSEQEAYRVKQRLAEWLEPRGLVFNEDKTKVVHADEGFDFLGFNALACPADSGSAPALPGATFLVRRLVAPGPAGRLCSPGRSILTC
ncbi:hypothetical protein ACFLIM_49705 [Nonomuraea sp. M3C6]|uniref:Reverse transcriptase (RNA-dependent DNA polymerase) n=1 Tax=Nonomuraea marmarensis TaxID=3351344 RepID=A0ABW7AYF4_9ACTN